VEDDAVLGDRDTCLQADVRLDQDVAVFPFFQCVGMTQDLDTPLAPFIGFQFVEEVLRTVSGFLDEMREEGDDLVLSFRCDLGGEDGGGDGAEQDRHGLFSLMDFF